MEHIPGIGTMRMVRAMLTSVLLPYEAALYKW